MAIWFHIDFERNPNSNHDRQKIEKLKNIFVMDNSKSIFSDIHTVFRVCGAAFHRHKVLK